MKISPSLHISCAYITMVVGGMFWFRFMGSPTLSPDMLSLILWVLFFVSSGVLTVRAFRFGTTTHRFLTWPLFLVQFVGATFYLQLILGTGR